MVNIAPSDGGWEFSYADRVVEFAESNDMKIRFHPLIMGTGPREGKTIGEDWHPTPDWILNGDFNRQEMIDILYDYFETVMSRYGDRIGEWVVVNEPLWWGSGGGLKNSV
jgi:endo-1,4-beta-xylanase